MQKVLVSPKLFIEVIQWWSKSDPAYLKKYPFLRHALGKSENGHPANWIYIHGVCTASRMKDEAGEDADSGFERLLVFAGCAADGCGVASSPERGQYATSVDLGGNDREYPVNFIFIRRDGLRVEASGLDVVATFLATTGNLHSFDGKPALVLHDGRQIWYDDGQEMPALGIAA